MRLTFGCCFAYIIFLNLNHQYWYRLQKTSIRQVIISFYDMMSYDAHIQ